jgi:hypothetical protein
VENGHNLPELPACRRLILEIIYRAARDAQSANRHHRLGALAYFASDNYTADLDALGLPYHWLPVGVEMPANGPICPATAVIRIDGHQCECDGFNASLGG